MNYYEIIYYEKLNVFHMNRRDKMKKSKIYGVLVLLLISSAIFVTGCTDDELDVKQIAEKMQQKQDSIEDYSYTMYMTMEFGGQKMETEADMMYKKPNKLKTVQTQPAEMAGSVTVSDGETMWLYDAQQNTVMIMELSETPEQNEQDYLQLIGTMMNESDFSLEGIEKVDGRTTYVIDMSPKDESDDLGMLGDIKVWVDKETWMPLKMDMKDADGNPMYSMEYRNFQTNTGISDDEFQFEVPEGAKVQTLNMDELLMPQAMTLEEAGEEATFDILVPSYLPDGYEFDNAMVIQGFVETVSLTYKNGDEGLGISEIVFEDEPQTSQIMDSAEVVSINDVEGKLVTIYDDYKMLQWEIGNIQLTLSGSLDKEELIQIAESMH
ncbi:MAG: Outer membrane lipoprotein-sorting protein [Candidatus Methanocomedens sp.]|nr:MAG: Outer membrane lipoprotein-sorting protein [ANME-2 cluster archaeon]